MKFCDLNNDSRPHSEAGSRSSGARSNSSSVSPRSPFLAAAVLESRTVSSEVFGKGVDVLSSLSLLLQYLHNVASAFHQSCDRLLLSREFGPQTGAIPLPKNRPIRTSTSRRTNRSGRIRGSLSDGGELIQKSTQPSRIVSRRTFVQQRQDDGDVGRVIRRSVTQHGDNLNDGLPQSRRSSRESSARRKFVFDLGGNNNLDSSFTTSTRNSRPSTRLSQVQSSHAFGCNGGDDSPRGDQAKVEDWMLGLAKDVLICRDGEFSPIKNVISKNQKEKKGADYTAEPDKRSTNEGNDDDDDDDDDEDFEDEDDDDEDGLDFSMRNSSVNGHRGQLKRSYSSNCDQMSKAGFKILKNLLYAQKSLRVKLLLKVREQLSNWKTTLHEAEHRVNLLKVEVSNFDRKSFYKPVDECNKTMIRLKIELDRQVTSIQNGKPFGDEVSVQRLFDLLLRFDEGTLIAKSIEEIATKSHVLLQLAVSATFSMIISTAVQIPLKKIVAEVKRVIRKLNNQYASFNVKVCSFLVSATRTSFADGDPNEGSRTIKAEEDAEENRAEISELRDKLGASTNLEEASLLRQLGIVKENIHLLTTISDLQKAKMKPFGEWSETFSDLSNVVIQYSQPLHRPVFGSVAGPVASFCASFASAFDFLSRADAIGAFTKSLAEAILGLQNLQSETSSTAQSIKNQHLNSSQSFRHANVSLYSNSSHQLNIIAKDRYRRARLSCIEAQSQIVVKLLRKSQPQTSKIRDELANINSALEIVSQSYVMREDSSNLAESLLVSTLGSSFSLRKYGGFLYRDVVHCLRGDNRPLRSSSRFVLQALDTVKVNNGTNSKLSIPYPVRIAIATKFHMFEATVLRPHHGLDLCGDVIDISPSSKVVCLFPHQNDWVACLQPTSTARGSIFRVPRMVLKLHQHPCHIPEGAPQRMFASDWLCTLSVEAVESFFFKVFHGIKPFGQLILGGGDSPTEDEKESILLSILNSMQQTKTEKQEDGTSATDKQPVAVESRANFFAALHSPADESTHVPQQPTAVLQVVSVSSPGDPIAPEKDVPSNKITTVHNSSLQVDESDLDDQILPRPSGQSTTGLKTQPAFGPSMSSLGGAPFVSWLTFQHPSSASASAELLDEFQSKFGMQANEVLQVFSCALNVKILLHGKMFITDQVIAFYSAFNDTTLFSSYATKIVFPLDQVSEIHRRNTALIFQNAIQFVLVDGTSHLFASFLKREKVIRLLNDIYSSPTFSTQNESQSFKVDGIPITTKSGNFDRQLSHASVSDSGSAAASDAMGSSPPEGRGTPFAVTEVSEMVPDKSSDSKIGTLPSISYSHTLDAGSDAVIEPSWLLTAQSIRQAVVTLSLPLLESVQIFTSPSFSAETRALVPDILEMSESPFTPPLPSSLENFVTHYSADNISSESICTRNLCFTRKLNVPGGALLGLPKQSDVRENQTVYLEIIRNNPPEVSAIFVCNITQCSGIPYSDYFYCVTRHKFSPLNSTLTQHDMEIEVKFVKSTMLSKKITSSAYCEFADSLRAIRGAWHKLSIKSALPIPRSALPRKPGSSTTGSPPGLHSGISANQRNSPPCLLVGGTEMGSGSSDPPSPFSASTRTNQRVGSNTRNRNSNFSSGDKNEKQGSSDSNKKRHAHRYSEKLGPLVDQFLGDPKNIMIVLLSVVVSWLLVDRLTIGH